MTTHETKHGIFPYYWKLSDAKFTKDRGKVFSCFACGGGSTMGYKLAGFDVIGCNEIDKKLFDTYVVNHQPKYGYCEDIRTFRIREDLPDELFNLDILDGSPPCSSFSICGNREKDWGKEKKFREGQAMQTLDDLFFEFIALANRLQPKMVIAENVPGILLGNARKYCLRIFDEFDKAGYSVKHFLLDSSKMGVPQKRVRVFFIGLRKDLAPQFETLEDMFFQSFALDLQYDYPVIPFRKIRQDISECNISDKMKEYWTKCQPGLCFSSVHPTGSCFNDIKGHPDKPLPTIRASGLPYDYQTPRKITEIEVKLAGSFPQDYQTRLSINYIVGMSVPPVMMAHIANDVWEQILSKIGEV